MKHLFVYLRLLPLIASLLVGASLAAQNCDLNCIGALEQPLQVTLDNDCNVTITTDMVVPDIVACPGPKLLTVRDSTNAFLGQGVDLVPIVGAPYAGNRLSVTITDQATNAICVGYIRLADNTAPTISNCPELTVSCLESTLPTVLGIPTVSDNCNDTIVPTFIDNIILRDCLSDTAAIVLREWTAADRQGQSANCTQQINIIRAMAMAVRFPRDTVLAACGSANASPDSVGVPTLNGMPLMHGDLCGLLVDYQDDTTFLCQDYAYRIDRTWTVTEDCTDFFEDDVQVITIGDNVGPVFNCPSPQELVFTTDPGHCSATINLPTPDATDNCGGEVSFDVFTSYGGNGFEPFSDVEPGTYTVQYIATDPCGANTSCQSILTVEDNLSPIANCDDRIIVSLSNYGIALLNATAFDEGSRDNCASPVFVKARRTTVEACDNTNGDDSPAPGYQEWFDDRVVFCCEDLGEIPTPVILRVYEVDPGRGPVDPAREQNGDLAGRYTDCSSSVQVLDGVGPALAECPPPVTIQCTDEQEDLSIYGHGPSVRDNCGYSLDSTVVRSLNECNIGTITREWVATDAQNHRSRCSQIITVENNEILPESAITWPEDYTVYECGADVSEENLPVASQRPIINWRGCGTAAINLDEDVFTQSGQACYKVLRTWTVIDWCHHVPEAPNPIGHYVHVQKILVKDNTPPQITCPPSVSVDVSANCSTAFVELELPTATDCSTDIDITNDSQFSLSNGPNASGTYTLGTHTVRYFANDGCGNNAYCTTEITIADNKGPSVSCKGGVTVTLMPVNTGGVAGMVSANTLVASVADNCDPTNLLKYAIRRPGDGTIGTPTTVEVAFDCFDANSQQTVEVYATDSQGNSSYCTTMVSVQENGGNCNGQTGEGMIAGAVLTEDGIEVENVTIQVAGASDAMRYTDIDGSFMFNELNLGNDYTVMPQMNEDIMNGVTTFDIVQITKHILGTAPLSSPYKIIAADVDRSGHVSTLDVIKLRKLILVIDTQLPNNNTAWRFIDASYRFPDPTNPFLTYVPEVFNINNMNGPEMHADFIAVKVGDVDGSAQANSLQNGGRSNGGEMLEIKVDNVTVSADEVIEIPFKASYMDEWMGYQFTLEFDPNALDVMSIETGDLPNMYQEENFNFFDLESGLITTTWHEFDQSADNREVTLFTLQCRVKQAGELQDWLYMSSRVTKAEAITYDNEPGLVGLSFMQDVGVLGTTFELYQNRPNPWNNATIIPFELDPGGEADLSVYDMAGKRVYQIQSKFSAGYHELSISREDLPSVGLFYYTLTAGDQKATRKMVLMN